MNFIKNYITGIITIVFLVCPSICFSSYLIELKNGSTFITNHYWKKGRQIKFYYYEGVVGIEKDLVKGIRESDLPYIVEKPQPTKKENAPVETESKIPPHPEKKAFLEEKMRIATEIETVSTAFREAKAKKDRERTNEQWEKLLLLQKKLSALRNQVKTAHGGQIPFWWDKGNQM